MKRPVPLSVIFVCGAALSCGSDRTASAEEARGPDLAAAQERALDLANSAQVYQPMRFVSAIEQVRRPTDNPRPVDVVKPAPEVVEAAPEIVMDTASVASEPTVALSESASPPPTTSISRVPRIIPREAAPPDPVPGVDAGPSRDEERGPSLGTHVGVVIRGAPVDRDHCPPKRRPPTGGRGGR